ncbi:MAG TPA: PTS sugar transporter subunit IIA [Myxococcota bacterium]|nr:PTS sugar transporter subunit IIA [Myxococcota bacterium]
MALTARDAAALLNTSERQVYRWVDDGEIPHQRVNDQIRFNRTELLEWAASRRIEISLGRFDVGEDEPGPSLAAALRRGGVHRDFSGADREAVLRNVLELTQLPPNADRELIAETLLAREKSASTAIGEGVAVPHVRHPVVAPGEPCSVGVFYLSEPVPFGAPDGKPVRTVFMIVSPTVNAHLQIFARLAHALQDRGFAAAIERRVGDEELQTEAARIDTAAAVGESAR